MKYKGVWLKAGRMLGMILLVFLTGCAGTQGTESEEELPVVTIGRAWILNNNLWKNASGCLQHCWHFSYFFYLASGFIGAA